VRNPDDCIQRVDAQPDEIHGARLLDPDLAGSLMETVFFHRNDCKGTVLFCKGRGTILVLCLGWAAMACDDSYERSCMVAHCSMYSVNRGFDAVQELRTLRGRQAYGNYIYA